jgi:cytoskeletal protein CcmA (bactofilin family)
MFANKDKNIVNRRGTSPENKIKSFLGAGSVFEGRMVFIETMRLDGTFRGEISSEDILIVGDNAKLQAEVMVGTLIISGCFQGNIKAKMRVELRAPAQVNGVIEASAISIEDGVTFNGTIKMNGLDKAEEGEKAAA